MILLILNPKIRSMLNFLPRPSVFLLIVLCYFIFTVGCSSVPTLSQNGYEQALALMSVCNRQSEEGLALIKGTIEQSAEQGDLPDHEKRLLLKVVDLGEAGKWEAAKRQARTIMERQKSNLPR